MKIIGYTLMPFTLTAFFIGWVIGLVYAAFKSGFNSATKLLLNE